MVKSLTRGEAKDSALVSSRDAGLLEPPERPQGSPASSSVWSPWVGPGKPNLPLGLRGKAGGGDRVITFWLLWIFVAARRLSLAVVSGGSSLVAVHRLLLRVSSLVSEHAL